MPCDCFTEWVLFCFPGSGCGISDPSNYVPVSLKNKTKKGAFSGEKPRVPVHIEMICDVKTKYDKMKLSELGRYEKTCQIIYRWLVTQDL